MKFNKDSWKVGQRVRFRNGEEGEVARINDKSTFPIELKRDNRTTLYTGSSWSWCESPWDIVEILEEEKMEEEPKAWELIKHLEEGGSLTDRRKPADKYTLSEGTLYISLAGGGLRPAVYDINDIVQAPDSWRIHKEPAKYSVEIYAKDCNGIGDHTHALATYLGISSWKKLSGAPLAKKVRITVEEIE